MSGVSRLPQEHSALVAGSLHSTPEITNCLLLLEIKLERRAMWEGYSAKTKEQAHRPSFLL